MLMCFMALQEVTGSHRRICTIFSEDECFNVVIIFLEEKVHNHILNKMSNTVSIIFFYTITYRTDKIPEKSGKCCKGLLPETSFCHQKYKYKSDVCQESLFFFLSKSNHFHEQQNYLIQYTVTKSTADKIILAPRVILYKLPASISSQSQSFESRL